MTEFTRTFHPVGQGAFYSEKFVSKKEDGTVSECRVVYDCGSKHGEKWLKSRISSAFPEKSVNLLFLSHFHDDHYKGISLLEPEIIILPLLNEWDKAIFWIGHELKQNNFSKDYDAVLRNRFPRSRIIRILPMDEEPHAREGSETLFYEPRQADTADGGGIENLPSGSILNLPICKDWIYIPVNPKLDSKIVSKFQALLDEDPKIDKEELLKLDSRFFRAHKMRLKSIYEAIGNPNEYSMAVYSGPNRFQGNSDPINIDEFCNYPFNYHHYHRRLRHIFGYLWEYLFSGCLYLGDINLKETDANPSRVLMDIYKSLPSWITEDLTTVQVPHHGSIDNYNSFLNYHYDSKSKEWQKWNRPMIYVMSVGVRNSYGHPSPDVVSDLMEARHSLVILVTDDAVSFFIERCNY